MTKLRYCNLYHNRHTTATCHSSDVVSFIIHVLLLLNTLRLGQFGIILHQQCAIMQTGLESAKKRAGNNSGASTTATNGVDNV